MNTNPFTKLSLEKLKELEKKILISTRDPKMPGHQRRTALNELKQIREAMKKRKR